MIECGIYSITNKINGKQYFGSTNNCQTEQEAIDLVKKIRSKYEG